MSLRLSRRIKYTFENKSILICFEERRENWFLGVTKITVCTYDISGRYFNAQLVKRSLNLLIASNAKKKIEHK